MDFIYDSPSKKAIVIDGVKESNEIICRSTKNSHKISPDHTLSPENFKNMIII